MTERHEILRRHVEHGVRVFESLAVVRAVASELDLADRTTTALVAALRALAWEVSPAELIIDLIDDDGGCCVDVRLAPEDPEAAAAALQVLEPLFDVDAVVPHADPEGVTIRLKLDNLDDTAGFAARLVRVRDRTDISNPTAELARQHAELAFALARSRELQTAGEQLLAIVSHDLRGPLSVIKLSADMLLRLNAVSESGRSYIDRIQSSTERASRLTWDLLDFTSARLGTLSVAPQPSDVAELAGKTVDELRAAWPDREIRVAASSPAIANVDPVRVSQVITNLLSNAVRYGDTSAITVSACDTGADVTLSVHNRGNPIPADVQARLFAPFERHEDGSGQRGSYGLGLFIVAELARAHGGGVEVRSCETDGTTFTIRLPRAPEIPSNDVPGTASA